MDTETSSAEQAIDAAKVAAEKVEQSRQEQTGSILEQITTIAEGLATHQKNDADNFKEIKDTLANVADKILIENVVKAAVQVTVNGKLVDIKAHLDKQDENFADLKKKILPFDSLRTWFMRLVAGVIYLGTLAGAVYGIILLLEQLKIIT